MDLLTEFQGFDPVNGYVPEYPFSNLPEVASRARSILSGKTAEQIHSIARRLNSEFERYFSDLKYLAVNELTSKFQADPEAYEKFFQWDGGTPGNGRWLYRDEMDDELDIPTAQNSSEVDALKSIIEDRDFCFFLPAGAPTPEPNHWPEGKTHELFAVLALRLVADSIRWTKYGETRTNLSIAGAHAVEAMGAVCFAEQVREVEWLEQYHRKQILEASSSQDARLSDLAEKIRKEMAAEHVALEREKRTRRAEQLNVLRHSKTNAAKELVCSEWAKAVDAFSSAEKAGIHFANWLTTNGTLKAIEPRTVTNWIRDHAKEIGVRFR